MTAALVEDLAGVGTEFEQSCDTCDGCDNTAEWMLWARHNPACVEHSAFACHKHKEEAEASWVAALDNGWNCHCGYVHGGQLSDNFRAIRL